MHTDPPPPPPDAAPLPPPPGAPPPAAPPPALPRTARRDAERLRRLAVWVSRLLYATTAVATARLGVGLALAGDRGRFLDAFLPSVALDPASAAAATSGAGLLYTALQSVWWAAGVLFVIWLFWAYDVARPLGLRPRRDVAWAVIGWFVPLANLVVPKQIVDDLWRIGAPETGPVTAPPAPGTLRVVDRSIAVHPYVHAWWTTYLLSGLATAATVAWHLTAALLGDVATIPTPSPAVLWAGFLLGDALTVAAGLLAAHVVTRLTARLAARVDGQVVASPA